MTGKHRAKREPKKPAPEKSVCPHVDDPLCRKYGCPDDPSWKGDGCRG